jgi:hypothetical protein
MMLTRSGLWRVIISARRLYERMTNDLGGGLKRVFEQFVFLVLQIFSFVQAPFHPGGWLLSTSVTTLSGYQSFRSFAGCFCASMYYQCLMNSLYTMIPTTNVSILMLSKASLTFIVATILLFHPVVHLYLRFLLIVTNDKPTSQQDRRLRNAMMFVARTCVSVHSPRIPVPGQPFNSPQRPNPTRLHDKCRLTQWLPNPPDRKRPQNVPMPHH